MIDVKESAARRREWSIIKRPRGRNARIHRLVDVAIAKQLRAVRADITHFKHAVPEQLALKIEIVVLNVRSAQVWIDREHI